MYLQSIGRIDKQVADSACRAFSHWWTSWGRGLLNGGPGRLKLPGRGRPVETPELVLLEDAVAVVITELTHLRDAYRAQPTNWTRRSWLEAHLARMAPDLRDAFLWDALGQDLRVLGVSAPEWGRVRQASAERVVAAILGWSRRDLHRWLTDRWRIDRADLRLGHCDECGREIFRRRSEPQRQPLCAVCRERRLWMTVYGPLRRDD